MTPELGRALARIFLVLCDFEFYGNWSTPPAMGGDRGGGKKGGKRGIKGVKKPPPPSLVSFGGPGWGVFSKLPKGGEFLTPSLCLCGLKRPQPPLDLEGPVFDCPLRGQ